MTSSAQSPVIRGLSFATMLLVSITTLLALTCAARYGAAQTIDEAPRNRITALDVVAGTADDLDPNADDNV